MSDLALEAFAHAVEMIQHSAQQAAWSAEAPSVLFKPSLSADGSAWCALYGADLQSGVAGFGDTPAAAMMDFDRAWRQQLTPQASRAALLQEGDR